jgi:hypothetical protein
VISWSAYDLLIQLAGASLAHTHSRTAACCSLAQEQATARAAQLNYHIAEEQKQRLNASMAAEKAFKAECDVSVSAQSAI